MLAVRWTAVVNRTAGRHDRRSFRRVAEALEAGDVPMEVTRDAADGLAAARDALAAGRGVVACGGDGTVAPLAALAAAEGGALAVVPMGSGNDFARALGLDPRRPADAVAHVLEGALTRLDLGRARTADGTVRLFTTVAHVGLDAAANERVNRIRGRHGSIAYALAALRLLPTYRPRPLRVQVDGDTWEGRAWLAAAGNAPNYGGGMAITPDAELRDGRLDVCVVGDVTRRTLLARFATVYRGTHVRIAGVHTFRGARILLEEPEDPTDAGRAPLELWASGERIGPLPATLDVLPDALRVVVPRQLGVPRADPRDQTPRFRPW
jgi:diacylglycerol kinase (ATP)